MPQAYEATIGQFTKMDGKNGIALMGMLLLTLRRRSPERRSAALSREAPTAKSVIPAKAGNPA